MPHFLHYTCIIKHVVEKVVVISQRLQLPFVDMFSAFKRPITTAAVHIHKYFFIYVFFFTLMSTIKFQKRRRDSEKGTRR